MWSAAKPDRLARTASSRDRRSSMSEELRRGRGRRGSSRGTSARSPAPDRLTSPTRSSSSRAAPTASGGGLEVPGELRDVEVRVAQHRAVGGLRDVVQAPHVQRAHGRHGIGWLAGWCHWPRRGHRTGGVSGHDDPRRGAEPRQGTVPRLVGCLPGQLAGGRRTAVSQELRAPRGLVALADGRRRRASAAARAGNRGSARAPRGPGRGPTNRAAQRRPARGGSRCARRRSPRRCARRRARPRPGSPRPARRSGGRRRPGRGPRRRPAPRAAPARPAGWSAGGSPSRLGCVIR